MKRSGGHEDESDALRVGAAVAGAAAGVAADLLVDGAGGVVVGAAAGQALNQVIERAAGVRRRQAEAMLQVAAETTRQTFDELLERITADPHRLQLAAAAVKAAYDTALQAKISALGRALATGAMATDDAVIDEQRVLVDILAGLEAPHVRVLAQTSEEHPSAREIRRDGRPQEPGGWGYQTATELLGGESGIARPVLSVLESHGLITDVTLGTAARETGYDRDSRGARYVVTPAGRYCLELLRERSGEDPGERTESADRSPSP
jgi:hypothetical protein